MAIFCRHDYRPAYKIRGENMLGHSLWAVAFLCTRCGRRRLDKGYSEAGAAAQLSRLQQIASR